MPQHNAQRSPATKESLKQIVISKENKTEKQGAEATLSCGVSEIINKAGESGMFINVKINGNILDFMVDIWGYDNIDIKKSNTGPSC